MFLFVHEKKYINNSYHKRQKNIIPFYVDRTKKFSSLAQGYIANKSLDSYSDLTSTPLLYLDHYTSLPPLKPASLSLVDD